jgi:hypothetical protein
MATVDLTQAMDAVISDGNDVCESHPPLAEHLQLLSEAVMDAAHLELDVTAYSDNDAKARSLFEASAFLRELANKVTNSH